MVDVVDLSQTLFEFLKSADEASTVRDLLVSGAASVLEAGDVSPELLSTRESARTEETKILALSVQDAGEDPGPIRPMTVQRAVIRGYDRFNGFRSLRSFREAVLAIFPRDRNRLLVVTVGKGRGLLQVHYGGNSGHKFDKAYQTDYLAIYFQATMEFGG